MAKPNNPYFAANLEFYLDERNMTQQELASRIYKDSSMISNYKKDRRNLDDETLLAIAKALDVSVEDLLKPRTVIDNKISGVKKSLASEELTDEERMDYADKTFKAIPNFESERIIDKKNAKEKLGSIIIKHPIGRIIVYAIFAIGVILFYHPQPITKFYSLIAFMISILICGNSIVNAKYIRAINFIIHSVLCMTSTSAVFMLLIIIWELKFQLKL